MQNIYQLFYKDKELSLKFNITPMSNKTIKEWTFYLINENFYFSEEEFINYFCENIINKKILEQEQTNSMRI